jgi:hypothetical protein
MGEVARPGVFELSLPQLRLLDLVILAGGSMPDASGNVRVIRGGRSGWQTWLTPETTFSLRAGDLVVVDSGRSVDRRSSSFLQSAPAAAGARVSARPAAEIVPLGIVQLISRPVVLNLTRDQASVKSVLSLLHQPLRNNGKLTVVKPVGGLETYECDQPEDVPLPSGAVLIFDPATVNTAVLPQLPAAISLESIGTTPPASVPEPIIEAPVGEPLFPTGPRESGERPEFVPRKLPAYNSAAVRRDTRRLRPIREDARTQRRSPHLSGLLAVAVLLSSAMLVVWLQRTSIFKRLAMGIGRAVNVNLWMRTSSGTPQIAATNELLPHESENSEYRLQQPPVDATQESNGSGFDTESPARHRPQAEIESRSYGMLSLGTGRQVRRDGGHLPGGSAALDRALAALDEKK